MNSYGASDLSIPSTRAPSPQKTSAAPGKVSGAVDEATNLEHSNTSTSDRAARLRQRVLEALRAGDRTGDWRRVAELLDQADTESQRADRNRELAADLLAQACR